MSLELDHEARIISYEEYAPYGSTTYQAVRRDVEVSPKRYRYTRMERDEESGLSHHAARLYATWLGRWVSSDSSVPNSDGLNSYSYCAENPTNHSDSTGLEGEKGTHQGSATLEEKEARYEFFTACVPYSSKIILR